MTVAFNTIPGNLRVPFFFAEINAGQSPFQGTSRTLLIGQKLTTGTAVANSIGRLDRNAEQLFGAGSILYDMAVWARVNNPFGEIWYGCLDDTTGTAEVRTITVSGISANTGVITLYIGGEKLTVNVSPSDTNNTIATAIAAAINAGYVKFGRVMAFPFAAAAAAAVVTLTARNKGALHTTVAIDKDLVGDEGSLQGTMTIATTTPGAGVPALTTLLANLGDVEFDHIISPYSDTTSLDAVKSLLNEVSGRWSPLMQLYGHHTTVKFDTYSNLAAAGAARNNPNETIIGVPNSPSPAWRWAAAAGGVIGAHMNLGVELSAAVEISRPLQTLELVGIKPPKIRGDAFDVTERNALYQDGIAGWTVGVDGTVRLDRVVTTYQVNANNQPDITWLDIETRCQMVYIARYFKFLITQTFPRCALADDNPNALQGLVTVKQLRALIIHGYKELEAAGITEKSSLFEEALIVERASDPSRVNAYLPVDSVNQFRVFAANITTFLEYPGV